MNESPVESIQEDVMEDKVLEVWVSLYREQDTKQVQLQLGEQFKPIEREHYDPSRVDLCIVDRPSWTDIQSDLEEIRKRQHPLTVPVLLLTSHVQNLPDNILAAVDEIISTPIQTKVFNLRLQSLRQLRLDSLTLQQKNNHLKQYREAMEAANSGVIMTDYRQPDNPITYVNKAFEEITGYKQDEVFGQNCRFLQNDDRSQEALEKIRECVKNGNSCQVTLRNYTKEGDLFWNNMKIAPIRNRSGKVTHFVGIMNDITEKYQTQQKLNREYLKFSQLFENDPAGIAECDAKGTILSVNSAFTNMFGYQEEEAVGKNLDKLLTRTEKERRNAEKMTQVHLQESAQEEMIRYDKNDNPINLLGAGAPIMENGEIWKFYAIYVDITEQKRLEEQNRQLLEQERHLRARAEESRKTFEEMFQVAPSAICLLEGPDHHFTYVNESYRELTRKKDYIGCSIRDVFPEIEDQGFYDLLDDVYENGEAHMAEKQPIRMWDEWDREYFEKAIDYVYKPLRDKHGEIYGIFVEAVDVTEEVEYREELKKRIREKETLLEEIHHRVKNNLAVVSGLLYMQAEKSEDTEVRSSLEDSLTRIQSMALVHEQLYRQSETESAIFMDNYLPKLAETIAQSHRNEDGESIEVEVDADHIKMSLPRSVPVGLITTELINNAYKHAFPNGKNGRVKVSLKKREQGLQLAVEDNGKGLQDDFSLSGTSLGMQIIQNLTSQIDGEISYESEPGKGTRFEIMMPDNIKR